MNDTICEYLIENLDFDFVNFCREQYNSPNFKVIDQTIKDIMVQR